MKTFPCDRCGACCRNVHLAKETQALDRGDGACQYYDATSKQCSIYAERPSICRVDEQYVTNYQVLMTWDEFVEVNLQACKQLKKL
ncbi:MAG: YkgJ family cysteine cluster protein [Thiothrix sp.]|nr:MAG: YkgJ family cysteine cluster protein [Thiothrix sp.]